MPPSVRDVCVNACSCRFRGLVKRMGAVDVSVLAGSHLPRTATISPNESHGCGGRLARFPSSRKVTHNCRAASPLTVR